MKLTDEQWETLLADTDAYLQEWSAKRNDPKPFVLKDEFASQMIRVSALLEVLGNSDSACQILASAIISMRGLEKEQGIVLSELSPDEVLRVFVESSSVEIPLSRRQCPKTEELKSRP